MARHRFWNLFAPFYQWFVTLFLDRSYQEMTEWAVRQLPLGSSVLECELSAGSCLAFPVT